MSPAAERVMARADALAAISETPDALTRVYLSAQHLQANQLVGQWMSQAGMTVWQDSVGNICGRYEGAQEGAQAVLLGSHLDTVRNAGRYDGMLGVLTAIEVVDSLHQKGLHLAQAIEIVGFCDEEGTRFGITLLGSRGLSGTWPQDWLEKTDASGISVAQAMVQVGLDPGRVSHAARRPEDFSAYLELHIEQGPCLEQDGLALGVVEAINGARRLNCRFTGEAGHAGTVPMNHRKDALAAAAEWMVLIENTTRQQGGNRVATVGALPARCGKRDPRRGSALAGYPRSAGCAAGSVAGRIAGKCAGNRVATRTAVQRRGVLPHRRHAVRYPPAKRVRGGRRIGAGAFTVAAQRRGP